MENTKAESVDKILKWGIGVIGIMLVIYIFSCFKRDVTVDIFDNSSSFFVNFIISIAYIVVVLFNNLPKKIRKIDKRLIVISLIQFSISSFTLNNSITIFSLFSVWVNVYLILTYSAFLSICFIDKFPKTLRYIVFFLLGAGIILTTYFAVYLAPVYHIAILGLIFFGLSLHLLIPLLVTIGILIIIIKIEKTYKEKLLLYLGMFVPVAITLVFLFQWNNLKTDIHKSTSSVITRPDNKLPEWVLLCQDMPTDPFSQKIIKGKLVYDSFENMFNSFGNTSFDEVKRHDPLVNIGLAVFGDISLDDNTRVKILKSQFNARHLAQRKIWSGRELGTIEVLNDIKIYPDYRLAYTEKTISIKNYNSWENNQQEAAFTFYLPEGSVATSLSLWINGKEEKSRLTTKAKADSAYVSIVGVELRDPALLHWQEGNTLTVTIFPCTPKENRRFKIGITSPLQKVNDIIKLPNVYFDGPISTNILETSKVEFVSENDIQNIEIPSKFTKGLNNTYTYDGDFIPYWEVSCNTTKLSKNKFYFNKHSYSVTETVKQTYKFNPDSIYLDINRSWSESEYNQILSILSDKVVFAHHDKLIRINAENKSEIFNALSKKNFSLFPLNEISNWKNSLLISKSTELSPNLSDLEGSEFLTELIEGIASTKDKVNLFQIGETTSPYLKSLKELQLLNFNTGTIDTLSQIINKQVFYTYNSDPNLINLDLAGICIVKDTSYAQSNAPDHLLRLFAYNNIMKIMGRNYFSKSNAHINNLVEIANEAYVVSPVSSLIVLETVKDYERFDISDNENSLKNASKKSSGSVPEPKEWVLIILLIGIISLLYFNKKKLAFWKL